ncbi:hypothetical protein D043_0423B, partial [Vibrio parahaemolyticus EKP-021]
RHACTRACSTWRAVECLIAIKNGIASRCAFLRWFPCPKYMGDAANRGIIWMDAFHCFRNGGAHFGGEH